MSKKSKMFHLMSSGPGRAGPAREAHGPAKPAPGGPLGRSARRVRRAATHHGAIARARRAPRRAWCTAPLPSGPEGVLVAEVVLPVHENLRDKLEGEETHEDHLLSTRAQAYLRTQSGLNRVCDGAFASRDCRRHQNSNLMRQSWCGQLPAGKLPDEFESTLLSSLPARKAAAPRAVLSSVAEHGNLRLPRVSRRGPPGGGGLFARPRPTQRPGPLSSSPGSARRRAAAGAPAPSRSRPWSIPTFRVRAGNPGAGRGSHRAAVAPTPRR